MKVKRLVRVETKSHDRLTKLDIEIQEEIDGCIEYSKENEYLFVELSGQPFFDPVDLLWCQVVCVYDYFEMED